MGKSADLTAVHETLRHNVNVVVFVSVFVSAMRWQLVQGESGLQTDKRTVLSDTLLLLYFTFLILYYYFLEPCTTIIKTERKKKHIFHNVLIYGVLQNIWIK